ncbi:hypothetical protein RGU11_02205 [Rossellomorea marisflavi]|jgi:hypothetical protein|uniref:hypothetical protein n=1 Tax=Rossellomorea marisflavi TaxID=189381 RepID=UPI0028533F07|nr:hypothetical protein [Rossellomorea marisflavi]MDR4935190.1 hypothetical protein [Rossellomorea marisflavi]
MAWMMSIASLDDSFGLSWMNLHDSLPHDGRRLDVQFRCGCLLSTGRKSSLLILAGSRPFLYSRWSQAASASLHYLVERGF